MVSLPVFNLGGFENSTGTSRKSYCTKLDKFCSEIGFLLIENHAVPDKIIESQWSAVEQFFSQEPNAKMKVGVPYPGYYMMMLVKFQAWLPHHFGILLLWSKRWLIVIVQKKNNKGFNHLFCSGPYLQNLASGRLRLSQPD